MVKIADILCISVTTTAAVLLTFQAGLQQRINDQETTIQKMKAELLRAGFAQQSLETEKVTIHYLYSFMSYTTYAYVCVHTRPHAHT